MSHIQHSEMQVKEVLHQFPKTDLHVHLDGSLRIDTILDLAQKQKVKLPTEDKAALKKLVVADEQVANLEDYLRAFEITLSVMQTEDALVRTAYELAEDAAKENVRYMEVRYSPILHTHSGLKLTEINDAVLLGLRKAERDFDIRTGVIICGMRNIDPSNSLMLAELAVAYKNKGVVAFDLAGAEYNYPAKDHLEAFYLIRNNNINSTIHAGEAYGPKSIHQAIHYCGAHRIGHGVKLKEDGDLLNYVNDHRIPLEICLTSNVQTRAVSEVAHHPLRLYYDYGLMVSLNTDNRLVSDTTVTDEFMLAHQELNFTLEELGDMAIMGFHSAFLPYREKLWYIQETCEQVQQILQKQYDAMGEHS